MTNRPLTVGYVGNFGPEWSTENHIRQALEHLGHTVIPIQESGLDWTTLPGQTIGACHFVLWTRTAGFDPADLDIQAAAIETIREYVPVIGYHLDRWIGLNREPDIHRSPFFQSTTLVCTADGGHQAEFAQAGVQHYWFPPAILEAETVLGTPSREYAGVEVAFVGNLTNYGHPEWGPYRRQLHDHLAKRYGRRFQVYPKPGQNQIRGRRLADLYATVPVIVGDSCLAGGATRYWSDRIPETLGRGGYLIHPEVEGLRDVYTVDGAYRGPDVYQLGEFDRLGHLIDQALGHPREAEWWALAGREHVIQHHTYERRMTELVDLLDRLELL